MKPDDPHEYRVRYPSFDDAYIDAELQRRKGVKLVAYFCPRCKGVHLEPWR